MITVKKTVLNQKVEEVMHIAGKDFGMDAMALESLKNSRVARLISAIPFLSETRAPKTDAYTNLSIFLLSLQEGGREIYKNRPVHDAGVLARLEPINRFNGGDANVQKKGMALIALSMLHDYKRDVYEDIALKKHNPLANAAWDFETERNQLEEQIRSVESPEMDEIMSIGDSTQSFWSA
jgi:hypothetical protein